MAMSSRRTSAAVLPAAIERALSDIFGTSARGVRLAPNSRYVRWHGRAVATTRKNTIYLRGGIDAFAANPELMLHEYFHVIEQWGTGRLNKRKYLLECCQRGYQRNRFEVEAREFAARELGRFQQLMMRYAA